MKLGPKIRKLRLARGLNKSQFAERVGVSPTAVHNWEEGYTAPRDDSLAKIAKALGVSISQLQSASPAEVQKPAVQKAIVSDARAKIAAAYGVPLNQVEIQVKL